MIVECEAHTGLTRKATRLELQMKQKLPEWAREKRTHVLDFM